MKKIWLFIAKVIILLFALVGAYSVFMDWQYQSVKKKVERIESSRTFDPDLKYNMPLGEPIFMVRPDNKATLFFIDGFRGQIGAGHYSPWFEELYGKGVNVVAPITGLQGWPFAYRTRAWHREEDMRQALQIYDAYCANLPQDHRVIVASMSFGALSNVTIGAKGKRKPDAMAFVSPLNTGLDYKSGNALVRYLSSRIDLLQYVMPYMVRGKNKARATLYDIVNEEKNLAAWDAVLKDTVNYEENLPQGVELNASARYMEDELIPQIRGERIVILYGQEDLTFSAKGFESLASKFRAAGNDVKSYAFPNSGHMLLYDNGGDRAKEIIQGFMMGSQSELP